MKIWLLRTSTKKISHKASWKLRPKNMKMVFSPWNASNIFRPPKTQSQRSFQIFYALKSVFRKFCFCEHKVSPIHMISSHTHTPFPLLYIFSSIFRRFIKISIEQIYKFMQSAYSRANRVGLYNLQSHREHQ